MLDVLLVDEQRFPMYQKQVNAPQPARSVTVSVKPEVQKILKISLCIDIIVRETWIQRK